MITAVTGATGHIGANLVRALLAAGRSVRCVVRRDRIALAGLDVERVEGDVRNPASLRDAFRGATTVFHLAAVISIDGDRLGLVAETNVEGARNAAEAALASGVRRFVHCSSIHAFVQDGPSSTVDESTPRALGGRHAAYDRSKAMGEQAVREAVARGLDAVIVHPTAVIGPWDFKPSRMGRLLLDLHRRGLPSLVPGGFDWVDVRDVVAGLIRAEERGRSNESYLLSGRYAPVTELARLAAAVTGVPPPRWSAPFWLARAAAPFSTAVGRVRGREPLFTTESLDVLAMGTRVDCGKARLELGYSARDLRTTLRDTYAWFAESGRIRLTGPLTASPADDGPGVRA
jgi:dihydroflavonol-4-reductase